MLTSVFDLSPFIRIDDRQCKVTTIINQPSHQCNQIYSTRSITMELEKQTEDIALFSVTDTGCGISPENQNKIFNRFEKLNENAQGTGLGLSICQLIISSWAAKYGLTPIMRKEPVSCSHTPFTMSNKERRKPNETSPAPDPSIMLHPHRKSQHRDCFGIRQPDKGVGNITVRYDTAECSQSNHQNRTKQPAMYPIFGCINERSIATGK